MAITTSMKNMTTTEPNAASPALARHGTPDWTWQQHAFRAMNTGIAVAVYARQAGHGEAVEALFRRNEQCMSRFLPDSDLALLNREPAGSTCVSAGLFDALEVALWAASVSGGLYDPTILGDLEAAGYDRSFEYVARRAGYQWPVAADLAGTPHVTRRRTADYTAVSLHRPTRQVSRPAGVRLDLGGMGKGWTVDRAAELLSGEGPFLVNAGGDLYAHGQPGERRGWEVLLEHPLAADRWMARLYLDHAGLATSTVMKRRWSHNGRAAHHLIDPRTGEPADTDAISVTVVAQRTVLAEIFAKVALILGVTAGLAWLAETDGIEGLIYTADGRIVTTPGLAPMLDAVEPAGVRMA